MILNALKFVETHTFEFDSFPMNNIESFLSNSEGTLGLEWYVSKEKINKSIFTQSMLSEIPRKPKVILSDEYKELSCFSLSNYRASCFPFRLQLRENVLDSIIRYLNTTITTEKVFMQILLKKITGDDFKINSKQSYFDYLNGIEMPTSNKVVRSIQLRILDFLQNKDEFLGKNPKIEGAEQKFNEDGFEAYIRFAIFGGTKLKRDQLAKKIKLGFSIMNYSNSWIMSYHLNKKGFMDSINFRKPTLFPSNTILCVSELLPLFGIGETLEIGKPQEEVREVMIDHMDDSIFSHLPFGDKKDRKNDAQFPKKLNKALRKLNLIDNQEVIIQDIQHGSTVQKITFNLPAGLGITKLKGQLENLQTELALKDISIEQGREAGTVSLSIPQIERDAVYLRECVEDPDFQAFIKKNEVPFIIGLGEDGNVIFECLIRIKHLLICGTTGSGKSVFLNTILLIMLMLKSPKEMQMIMIDPKMVELKGFKPYPHVLDVITDMDKASAVLESVVEKMEIRYKAFEQKGYKNVQQYNRNEKDKLPYLIIVIDELADLMSTNPEVESNIIRLAQKARAAGIHLIIATQYPIKEVITSLIKRNIVSRICFALDSGIAYRVALDEKPEWDLLGRGDGIYRLEGIQGLHRFQGALIATNEEMQDDIIKTYSTLWKEGGFKKETIETKEIKVESEIDKLKRIIAETGETKVSELRDKMEININRLKEHMEQLVLDGWLKAPKVRSKGYELLLSEEDKKRYLETLKK